MIRSFFINLFKVLDLIGGVFAGILVLYSGISFLINNITKAPLTLKILLFIFVILLVVFVIRQFKKIKNTLLEKSINDDLKKKIISGINTKKFNIDVFPKTTDFKKWVRLLTLRAKKWSEDAEISDYSFFYGLSWRQEFGVSHSFGVGFYSNQRGESLRLNIGDNYEILSESSFRNKPKLSIDYGEAPFYLKVPNWRKALIYVYRRMENKIDNGFELKITNGAEKKVFIYFSYTHGPKKIHSSFNAEYDGKVLTLYNTKEKITLS